MIIVQHLQHKTKSVLWCLLLWILVLSHDQEVSVDWGMPEALCLDTADFWYHLGLTTSIWITGSVLFKGFYQSELIKSALSFVLNFYWKVMFSLLIFLFFTVCIDECEAQSRGFLEETGERESPAAAPEHRKPEEGWTRDRAKTWLRKRRSVHFRKRSRNTTPSLLNIWL